MQFSNAALLALVAGYAAADVVTQFVHVTQVVHQKVNVYVDENGNPVSTVTDLVTEVSSPAAASPAPAAPTLQHTHAEDSTTYAAVTNNYLAAPPKETSSPAPAPAPAPAPTSEAAPAPAPATTEAPAPAPAPATTEAPAPAPAPSTTEAPAPAPAPATSEAPAPAPAPVTSAAPPASSPSSSDGGDFSGDATYYDPGLGACGETNSASDFIAALNVDQFNGFGAMSNGNPVCGKKAKLSHNGKSVTVTITDKCPGCKHGDLDLSPAAFDAIADESQGRVPITWSFI